MTWKQKSKCVVAKRRQRFSGEDVAVSGTVEQTDVSADWAGGGRGEGWGANTYLLILALTSFLPAQLQFLKKSEINAVD